MADYRVRPFERGDREAFLDLYERVFGRDGSDDWFDWKYAENPYLDEVPVVVATLDGRLVGARSFFPLAVRADDRTALALQPADTMVDPDHRRQGLFTRMTRLGLDRYADREPEFCFNFPNSATLSGNRKLGWRVVGPVPTYYRVNDPVGALAGSDSLSTVGRAMPAAVERITKARDQLAGRQRPSAAGVTVSRHAEVPVDDLLAVARRTVPGRLHARRNRTFFEWRFANPDWEYETFVAREAGRPVAAVVTGTRATDGVTVTTLCDVLPLCGRDRRGPFSALLSRVTEAFADSALLAASAGTAPAGLMSRHGFLRDDVPPLSAVSDVTVMAVRPLGEASDWTFGDRRLTDDDSWRLALAERDTR
ncbi:GNAT family N-acetyltransferase [Halorussus halobius]|uniref:GNAT family N-acetyltransferase n=1 Tax=Halorussus halobius TaxID=1710537 RepID=UPI001091DFC4|nr:GNAT family N-acetyltransferase [Halorussus halobius]